MHCRKHQGVNRVVEEIVLSLIRLGIVSFYNFKTPIFIGDDENDNDNNPTKIMLESGVCLHTPATSMIFVGLLSLPNSFLL